MVNPYFVGNSAETSPVLTTPDISIKEPKKLLAESFCEQAELCLLKGHYEKGKELFESAIQVDPNNAAIFYASGLAFYEYGSSEEHTEALKQATQSFKSATSLKTEFFAAWLNWSCALYDLGEITEGFHYFLEAKKKLDEAKKYAPSSKEQQGILYFREGLIQLAIANHSLEPFDFQVALKAFEKALQENGAQPHEFWQGYGEACLQLGDALAEIRYLVKAVSCYKNAIVVKDHKSWLDLADAFVKLYEYTHDEDHFNQAAETFAIAAQLSSDDEEVWLEWAEALLLAGRNTSHIKKIKQAIEKATHAAAFCEDLARVHAILAEALAHLGLLTDRLDLIYEGQNILSPYLEKDSDEPRIKLSTYHCLIAFGMYFQDMDYYYQAIEVLQEELSIDRSQHALWALMGRTYLLLTDLDPSRDHFEKAIKFYEKALAIKVYSSYVAEYAILLSKLGETTQSQSLLEHAVFEFERAIALQKNALYTHPSWLFHFAKTLDLLGNFFEEEYYYTRALEIYNHVCLMDPDFAGIHYHMALCYSHLGELNGESQSFYKALQHYRIAARHDEDNDQIILDWGICLINLSQHVHLSQDAELFLKDAESKLLQATKMGHMQGYYFLGCLHALLKNSGQALFFLEKAYQFYALPPLDDLLNDDWLDSIRDQKEFHHLLSRVENGLPPYEN